MTQPPGFDEDPLDALKLLAPLRSLDFQDDGQSTPFGLQAVVSFADVEPLLKVLVRAYSEANDLSQEQIDALNLRARALQVGVALYISAGEPTAPEEEDIEPEEDRVDPNDPLSLIIEFSVVDSDDPFVQRLLRVAEIVTIVDPSLRRDETDVYRYRHRRDMKVRVSRGRAGYTATGQGTLTVSAGQARWRRGKEFIVRGRARHGYRTYYIKYP
jgi:hypothetical protein